MKPDAPAGHPQRSSGRSDTVVPGIRRLRPDAAASPGTPTRCAIVRSLTHPSNNHEPSRLPHADRAGRTRPSPCRATSGTAVDFPNFGSVVSYFTPAGRPCRRRSPCRGRSATTASTYCGTYAGFLGPRHDPLEQAAGRTTRRSRPPTRLDAAAGPRPDAASPARHGLLEAARASRTRHLQNGRAAADLDEVPRAGHADDDVAGRPAGVRPRPRAAARPRPLRPQRVRRELPARPPAGRGRRQAGDHRLDVHRPRTAASRTCGTTTAAPPASAASPATTCSRSTYCLPPLDRGLSALLEDLSDRGLLDAHAGGGGRRVRPHAEDQRRAGRDHWGACQSALFAGGGIRGGQVYGASDKIAAYPKDNPVSPEDFLATIYHALGRRPRRRDPRPREPPAPLCDGNPVLSLLRTDVRRDTEVQSAQVCQSRPFGSLSDG